MMDGKSSMRFKPASAANQSPLLEAMEPRLMLSGNVWVGVIHGSLVIRGDAAANHIVIDQAGLGPNQFRVSGLDGTTIKGQANLVLDGVKRSVSVRLGDGIDVLELTDVAIARDLTVLDGRKGCSVTVTDGTVGGNVRVHADQGDNTITVDGTAIGGGLGVYTSGGSATVNIDHAVVDRGTAISCRSGAADVSMDSSSFGRDARIRTGAGEDSIQINNTLFHRRTVISTGTNSDLVSIEGTTADGTQFDKSLLVYLGKGNDRVNVGLTTDGGIAFVAIRLVGGRGDDSSYTEMNSSPLASYIGIEHQYSDGHI